MKLKPTVFLCHRTLLIVFAVFLGFSAAEPGRALQRKQIMEYYIYIRPELAWRNGYPQPRIEKAYKTRAEAEEARRKMAVDIGTHRGGMGIETHHEAEQKAFFLANSYIKEVPTGRYIDEPATEAKPVPKPSAPPAGASRQDSFESTKNLLVERMKSGLETSSFDGDNRGLTGRLKSGASAVSAAAENADAEVTAAKTVLERREPAAIQSFKASIVQRKIPANPQVQAIIRTLKINAPPPPPKKFDELLPGDVLLIGRAQNLSLNLDLWGNYYLRFFDRLTSWEWKSRASHTLMFVKEVKGVKLFLDGQPGEGPRIWTEDQVMERYGSRVIDVAQPTSEIDADALWAASRELGIKQITADLKKLEDSELSRLLNRGTNFGLYGQDNLVCSEISRFALVRAGLEIGETDSPIKKLLGIYFGPANFYSDGQPFLITPLELVRKDRHPVRQK